MVLRRTMNVSTVGKKDLIEQTFLNCQFVKIFVNSVIDWFNAANNSKFAPTIEEKYLVSFQALTKEKY